MNGNGGVNSQLPPKNMHGSNIEHEQQHQALPQRSSYLHQAHQQQKEYPGSVQQHYNNHSNQAAESGLVLLGSGIHNNSNNNNNPVLQSAHSSHELANNAGWAFSEEQTITVGGGGNGHQRSNSNPANSELSSPVVTTSGNICVGFKF